MKTQQPVPFLDLPAQQKAIAEEIREAVLPLFDGAMFIGGEPVNRFEAAYAEAHGIDHAVSLKSGTSALHLTMEALGVGPGDEVLVPCFTFIATAAPVARLGATPVFVDVDDITACMDPVKARAAITDRTKLILPVHLYGHPAPIKEIVALGKEFGIPVLEDCAQSHLATLDGQVMGTFGDAGAFSFYPSKNLGAAGDAGAMITRDGALAEKVRQLANHGRTGRYDHAFLGWNERLDAIQAAVLTVKLRHLPDWTNQRQTAAARYNELLAGLTPMGSELQLPVVRDGATHVYHLYVVRHPERDKLAAALGEAGIAAGTHYPTTLPAQEAFKVRGFGEGSFPVGEDWASTCLALPLFPEITETQQQAVAEALREV